MNKEKSERKIRVLLAKPGLDGHSVGIRVMARALRDQGFEVIFIGIRQRNEVIVNAAVQENVDVIGLSMLSGAHISIMRDFMKELADSGIKPLIVIGGVIPVEDYKKLYEMGIDGIFSTKQSFEEIAGFIKEGVSK